MSSLEFGCLYPGHCTMHGEHFKHECIDINDWDTSEYWLNEPDEDDPPDEFEEWLGGRCGFMPEFGTCSEAGSEECEFECPLRDEFYQQVKRNN